MTCSTPGLLYRRRRVTVVLTYLGGLLAFLAIYELLRRREERRTGTRPPVQWRWIAAAIGCALAATLYGVAADS